MVKAADLKEQRLIKSWFFDAAKVARKCLLSGKLPPMEVYEDGKEMRLLKRC